MQSQSRIGIVTISFNQARHLQEAIDSVRCGDPSRLQYIIVDPGSTDGSREIIERNRDRFSTVILEPDRGPADGLNRGFAACDADVLGYLNSDDRFAPGTLDFVLDYFDAQPDIDVLCGAIRIIDENGKPRVRKRTPDRIDLRRYAYEVCFFWQQATFFRRGAWLKTGGFNIHSRVIWDGELVVDMALRNCTFGYVNRLLGDFRIHGDSITGSGRHRAGLAADRRHVREKILAAGYPEASPLEARWMKLRYKFSLKRHLSYLLAPL